MTAIYKRELRSLFGGLTGPIFIAFLLVVVGVYMGIINFSGLYPQFEFVLGNVGFIFLLIVPILTMRTFAEERRQRTDQLLYSLPMSMLPIVLGKYLALLTVLALPTLLMCLYPLLLSMYGVVDFVTGYSSILAFFLMGASLLAIGMFFSSLTDNAIIAAVMSFAAMLLCYLAPDLAGYLPVSAYASFVAFTLVSAAVGLIIGRMTRNMVVGLGLTAACEGGLIALYLIDASLLEGSFQKVVTSLSMFERLYTFLNGMFDLTAIVFFLSVIGLFLFFTVQSLEKRRWS